MPMLDTTALVQLSEAYLAADAARRGADVEAEAALEAACGPDPFLVDESTDAELEAYCRRCDAWEESGEAAPHREAMARAFDAWADARDALADEVARLAGAAVEDCPPHLVASLELVDANLLRPRATPTGENARRLELAALGVRLTRGLR